MLADYVPDSPSSVVGTENPAAKEELITELRENLEELRNPLSFDDVAQILGSTVKRDKTAKIILFGSMLLTYTEEEQVNDLMAAESSSGKSYLPIEVSLYFPENDVVIIGGASPTSFFHEVSGGEFATWDPDKKQSRVNLANKILIFLDQPHDQLLQKLRPFLSHDKKEIKYKISDRSQKAGLRTKTIILIGYSTVIFCTANFNLDQQERTRVFQLSPETDPGKVQDALDLLLDKKSDREAFKQDLLTDDRRRLLSRRILDIKNSGVCDVVIGGPLKQIIKSRWKEHHPHSIPRHIRDLDRFLSLVKASALLNWRSREEAGEHRVRATLVDVEEAFKVYREIADSNELGLAPQIYEIFKEVIQPLGTVKVSETEVKTVGVKRQEILKEYYRIYHRSLPPQRLRKEILPPLDASGLISEESDPNDRRQNLVCPQVPATISRARGVIPSSADSSGNSGSRVGVDNWTENPPLLHPEMNRTLVSGPSSVNGPVSGEPRKVGDCALCRKQAPLVPYFRDPNWEVCEPCQQQQRSLGS